MTFTYVRKYSVYFKSADGRKIWFLVINIITLQTFKLVAI